MDTAPLFDLPDIPVVTAGEPDKRRPTRKPPDPAKVRWSKYRPAQRVACDDCLAELVAAGGGPVARAARWRRKQHGDDRLLCGGHMEQRRHDDGLAPLDDTDRLR